MDGNRVLWQLHVLELATARETPLSEKRSMDDQLEWLDNQNVLYWVRAKTMARARAPTSGAWPSNARTPPELFLRGAYSPATARGSPR